MPPEKLAANVCEPGARSSGVHVVTPSLVPTGTSTQPSIGVPPSVNVTVPPVCGTGVVVIFRAGASEVESSTVSVDVVGFVSTVTFA